MLLYKSGIIPPQKLDASMSCPNPSCIVSSPIRHIKTYINKEDSKDKTEFISHAYFYHVNWVICPIYPIQNSFWIGYIFGQIRQFTWSKLKIVLFPHKDSTQQSTSIRPPHEAPTYPLGIVLIRPRLCIHLYQLQTNRELK